MHEHPAGLLDRVLHVRDVRGAMPLVEVRRVVPGKECCETAHLLILPKDGWWSSVVVGGRRWSSMVVDRVEAAVAPARDATYAAVIRCGHPDGAGGNVCASERRMSFTGQTIVAGTPDRQGPLRAGSKQPPRTGPGGLACGCRSER